MEHIGIWLPPLLAFSGLLLYFKFAPCSWGNHRWRDPTDEELPHWDYVCEKCGEGAVI